MPPKPPARGKQPAPTAADLMRRRATRIPRSTVAPPHQKTSRPNRISVATKGPTIKEGDDLTDMGDGTDADEWMQTKTLLKPEDQLDLSEQQLKEEFTRILTANNPHAPQNIVRYSFKEKQFKQTSSVDQLAIHFALDGNMLHKESDEARRQKARLGIPDAVSDHAISEAGEAEGDVEEKEAESNKMYDDWEDEGPEGRDDSGTPAPAQRESKLTNQFNFSERASQTYNNPYRERGTATEPPPRATFSGNVTQWEIFDAYQEDFEKQPQQESDRPVSSYASAIGRMERNKEKKGLPGKKDEEKSRKKLTITETQGDDVSRVSFSAKIMERMVNQNTYDDIAQDFKYWEDVSDEYRDQEGTLLPLWKFSSETTKRLAVTSLCWSPQYHDLFAVGFGSYDFTKQGTGKIMFYSMKNPSYPEYSYTTESGIMCLDIHPENAYLLAAGYYDGTVGVFNVVENTEGPVYKCTAKNGKHTDPVWQVRWQKDDLDNNLNFYSLSSDGRVVSWTIVKNELTYQDVIPLTLSDTPNDGPDGTKLTTVGCGTAFDFHQKTDYLFLVGTEEGKIHMCSKAYSSQFLSTVDAHPMAVYKVCWNAFHPDIFITCSADWTVKIWEKNLADPLFMFDLNSAVGDVAWSPYSSTVFAAVTTDGRVHVYDLNQNKYEAVCEQVVAQKKKARLSHIAFNPVYPIIIVGDDRGNVTSLKLSPNLRRLPKAPVEEPEDDIPPMLLRHHEKKGAPVADPANKESGEIAKLEKIIAMVREPTDSNKS